MNNNNLPIDIINQIKWISNLADILPKRLVLNTLDKSFDYSKSLLAGLQMLNKLKCYSIIIIFENDLIGFYQEVNSRLINDNGFTCINTTDKLRSKRPLFFSFKIYQNNKYSDNN